jgi:hypothetical protein
MAATPPPGYTPPPADLPQRGDRATFSNRVDAWVTWFSTVILTQLAAMIANAYANALDAYASAADALGHKNAAQAAQTAAENARDAAQGYRDTAQGYRDAAAASATAAAASATAAASAAAAVTATSSTSLTLGTGARVFSTQAGKQFIPGQLLAASSASTPTARMFMSVDSYSGTTLTTTVTSFEGTGTYNDWVLAPAGARGPSGGISGGQLSGALDEKLGSNLASAATIDPWATGGNTMVLTGTVLVTGIAPAPQAGARRTLIAAAATPIQAGANVLIDGVTSGATYTLAAGDRVDIIAESTTSFHLNVRRRNGKATAGTVPVEVVLTIGQPWTVAASDFEIEICGGGQNGKSSGDYGGACGAYARKRYSGATIGATATVAVGSGGAATTVGTRNDGGASSFTLSGFTTVTCGGGTDTGAVATGGDVNINGVRGDGSCLIGAAYVSGAVVELRRAGRGADGMMGLGAPPHGTADSTYSATGFGSGGSSSRDTLSGSSATPSTVGSAGRDGVCKIRYML